MERITVYDGNWFYGGANGYLTRQQFLQITYHQHIYPKDVQWAYMPIQNNQVAIFFDKRITDLPYLAIDRYVFINQLAYSEFYLQLQGAGFNKQMASDIKYELTYLTSAYFYMEMQGPYYCFYFATVWDRMEAYDIVFSKLAPEYIKKIGSRDIAKNSPPIYVCDAMVESSDTTCATSTSALVSVGPSHNFKLEELPPTEQTLAELQKQLAYFVKVDAVTQLSDYIEYQKAMYAMLIEQEITYVRKEKAEELKFDSKAAEAEACGFKTHAKQIYKAISTLY